MNATARMPMMTGVSHPQMAQQADTMLHRGKHLRKISIFAGGTLEIARANT